MGDGSCRHGADLTTENREGTEGFGEDFVDAWAGFGTKVKKAASDFIIIIMIEGKLFSIIPIIKRSRAGYAVVNVRTVIF